MDGQPDGRSENIMPDNHKLPNGEFQNVLKHKMQRTFVLRTVDVMNRHKSFTDRNMLETVM